MDLEEKIISKKSIYKGNIIGVEYLNVLLPDGKEATRDVVTHPGASVIIPITESNEIYMVKQYRVPIEKVLLELPAGKLDRGEEPLTCAIRELKEETGVEAQKIKHVISVHSAPGFSNEVLHLYIATGLTEGEANTDEGEFISSEKIHVKKLVNMVLNGEITDAKSIIGILFAEKYLNTGKKL